MFEFNYIVGDIRNSDLGEGIICSGEGSGGKGGGKWGKGGREVGEKGEGSGVRGTEVGNAYPPVHPLTDNKEQVLFQRAQTCFITKTLLFKYIEHLISKN